jgi:hypothetical protein
MKVARTKLDVGKCKIEVGKTYTDYDVMFLSEDGNVLATVAIYKESGMTELQKKAIRKKLKSALEQMIANGI